MYTSYPPGLIPAARKLVDNVKHEIDVLAAARAIIDATTFERPHGFSVCVAVEDAVHRDTNVTHWTERLRAARRLQERAGMSLSCGHSILEARLRASDPRYTALCGPDGKHTTESRLYAKNARLRWIDDTLDELEELRDRREAALAEIADSYQRDAQRVRRLRLRHRCIGAAVILAAFAALFNYLPG